LLHTIKTIKCHKNGEKAEMAKRQRALINNGSFSVKRKSKQKTEIMTIIGNNIKVILIDTPKTREMLTTILITLNLFTRPKNA